MYPAQFEYSKAGSVAEAIQILQGDSDAKIIAGGHSLIPLMKCGWPVPPGWWTSAASPGCGASALAATPSASAP